MAGLAPAQPQPSSPELELSTTLSGVEAASFDGLFIVSKRRHSRRSRLTLAFSFYVRVELEKMYRNLDPCVVTRGRVTTPFIRTAMHTVCRDHMDITQQTDNSGSPEGPPHPVRCTSNCTVFAPDHTNFSTAHHLCRTTVTTRQRPPRAERRADCELRQLLKTS